MPAVLIEFSRRAPQAFKHQAETPTYPGVSKMTATMKTRMRTTIRPALNDEDNMVVTAWTDGPRVIRRRTLEQILDYHGISVIPHLISIFFIQRRRSSVAL